VFLPYLEGERCPVWDPHAVGVLFGLTSRHTRDDALRCVFEGVALALRHILETLENAGVPVTHITVMDAGGLNWAKIRASIYNRPLLLLDIANPTALGAMLLARAAIGLDDDPLQSVQEIIMPTRVVEPVREFVEPFSELFELYKGIYRVSQSVLSHRGQGEIPSDHEA
jgi:xylulokinase